MRFFLPYPKLFIVWKADTALSDDPERVMQQISFAKIRSWAFNAVTLMLLVSIPVKNELDR